MKRTITIPLTLIKPYLTEGQLAVILSNDKKQITGTILSTIADNDHYFIFRKKLYYNTNSEEKILVNYSGVITIKPTPISFVGRIYDIEIKLHLNSGKVESGEVNSAILPSGGNVSIKSGMRPLSGIATNNIVTRGNYDGPFLKLLKKLLSLLKSFFKKNDL
jgi:sporulation protein YlmC with PRC-barrel domain